MKTPNQKKAYNNLNLRLGSYVAQVQTIYDDISARIAKAVDLVDYDGSVEFLFKNYPELTSTIKGLMSDYVAQMGNLIYTGTSKEWKESNTMQDLLARKVLKAYNFEKGGDKYNRYFQPNSDALKAFQARTEKGMNLSSKLWNQSDSLKKELECTISTAIDKGQSAVVLSKRISQYLTDYPSMKADYEEKFGHAIKCKDCQYASMRLARTEINMAYRTAEQNRWRQFDFILGYEVKLSKRHPAHDICNDLQGKYPKDFNFVGWHPNCMCYVVPIIMSDEQYYGSDRVKKEAQIDRTPKSFNDWVRVNRMRIGRTQHLPYFLKDNRKYWNLSVEDAAKYRHADRDEKAIRIAARNRNLLQYASEVNDLEIASLRLNAMKYGIDISNFEKYISTHKFKESFDLMTYEQEQILSDMIEKYKVQIDKAQYEFSLFKSSYKNKLDYSYDFGNWKKEAKEKISNIYPTRFTSAAELRAKVKDTYEEIRKELHELRTVAIKPKKIIEDFDDFDLQVAISAEDGVNAAKVLLQKLYGPSYINTSIWRQIESASKAKGWFEGYNVFRKEYTGGLKGVMEAATHLNELTTADLSVIPQRWIPRFNDYIKTIETAQIDIKGYNKVYREIEGAYNIYKLSTDKELIEYGLEKLSFNTPHTIVEGFRSIGMSPTKWLGEKEFYDTFDKFVPCISLNESKAYYSPKYQHVRIDFIGYKDRLQESKWKRKTLQYHEFGHAKANLQGVWEDNKEWVNLFQKFYDDYNQDGNFYEKTYSTGRKVKRWKIADEYWKIDYKYNSPKYKDTMEPLGAISDTLQALSKDKARIGSIGHDVDYFANSEYLCKAEIIAHLSENYWLGNKYFKMVMPRFYNEAMALYTKFLKSNLPTKR